MNFKGNPHEKGGIIKTQFCQVIFLIEILTHKTFKYMFLVS